MRRTLFAGPADKPLDLLMPPQYDLTDDQRMHDRAEIERLIDSLRPGAVDAGSREVLFNLINGMAAEALARLDAERDERRAIARVLFGMAAEVLARQSARYNADKVAASQVSMALALVFEEITGRKAAEFLAAGPGDTVGDSLHSSVGAVDLHHEAAVSTSLAAVDLGIDRDGEAAEGKERVDAGR